MTTSQIKGEEWMARRRWMQEEKDKFFEEVQFFSSVEGAAFSQYHNKAYELYHNAQCKDAVELIVLALNKLDKCKPEKETTQRNTS